MTARKRRAKVDDPLLRACTACGASVREGCRTLGKGGMPLPLVPIASRLVHADRIEQPGGSGG